MKQLLLSMLAYESVKECVDNPSNNFDYEQFRRGTYRTDTMYSHAIAKVFSAINLALSRLCDSNKVEYFTTLLKPTKSLEEGTYYYTILEDEFVGEIKNVFTFSGGKHINYPFKNAGTRYLLSNGENTLIKIGKKVRLYFVSNIVHPCEKLYVEYSIQLPKFYEDDIYINSVDEEKDVDLTEFNITNSMYSYIKEFVKGQLMETLEPSIANEINARAENYLADLPTYNSAFNQVAIKRSY